MKTISRFLLATSLGVLAFPLQVFGAEESQLPARHPSYEPSLATATAEASEPKGAGMAVGFKGGVGDTDTRYPATGALSLANPSGGVHLQAWRGERVSAQVVVTSDQAEKNLRIAQLQLSRNGGAIGAQTHFVRYTLANNPPTDDPAAGCGPNTIFDYVGLYPDILDTADRVDLPAHTNRPIWLTVDVPAETEAGTYHGTLVVRSDSGVVRFPVTLDVVEALLPTPQDWSFQLDLWQQPESVARYHQVPLWSDEHFALLKPLMKRLANAGQKTITCSLFNEPWNAQTYDLIPGMVDWRKKADGTWEYDYTVFDRWVTFMSDEVGLDQARIHCYSMIPWSLTFRYFDEATQATVDAELTPGTPEYDEYWGRFLKDFVRHLKVKGWLERTRISMDERPDEQMEGALATLAKHMPELEVASAVNEPTELTRHLNDVSQVLLDEFHFSREELEDRAREGKVSTFYVCCGPTRPNTFTFSPPAEAEWLGLFASANGFHGVLRWAYNSWVEDPFVSTDFVTWPSGDCFLVYPGNRSSIRFERFREGIEDFEKIRLLREWAAASPTREKTAALDDLDAVLKDFSWPRGSEAGIHAGDVRRAVDAIAKATQVIVKSR